ncbi:MAG TPA: (2Fe-2S)-binding protein [Clostridia bacterium]|nr:(2Fe-2S)-binding protein [Clostridia bacterium]
MKRSIHVRVNDIGYDVMCSENATLVTLLREELGLTGTKEGCGAGECGACTVIFNGLAVNACMVMAMEAEGADIRTIEGEAKNGELSDLQKSFLQHNALQCGFCTPGMIMRARALLNKNPHPTRDEILEAMEGNLCRCTGYETILAAVAAIAGEENGE